MAKLFCTSQCSAPTWNNVALHLAAALGLWVLMIFGGAAFICRDRTANVEGTRSSLSIVRARIHSSTRYCILSIVVATAQCVVFVIRTYLKIVDLPGFAIDVLSLSFWFFDFAVGWAYSFFHGFSAGVRFMVTTAVLDCIIIASFVCLLILEENGAKGWFSFSYLAMFYVLKFWTRFLEAAQLNLDVLTHRLVDQAVKITTMIFLSAVTIMTLENLGDLQALKGLNEEKWNTISSLYFIFITVSTVGYGDLKPETAFGRIFTVITIFAGVLLLLQTMRSTLQAVSRASKYGGLFKKPAGSKHVVVLGNPSPATAADFIIELFHPDHSEEALDMHAVFMFPPGDSAMGATKRWLLEPPNVYLVPRVHLLQGSILNSADVMRVCAHEAETFFIFPNMSCSDAKDEDMESIIRFISLRKEFPNASIVLVLMKAEHRDLLSHGGVGVEAKSPTYIAIDQFKLELVGKSCQVPGFLTIVSNLCKMYATDENENDDKPAQDWQAEYEAGLGHEVYVVELSPVYSQRKAIFIEVVLDVLQQTDGSVYLLGLVETTDETAPRVLINPGASYLIKPQSVTHTQTCGIFIAPDRDAIVQCEGHMVFLGRTEGNSADVPAWKTQDVDKGSNAQQNKATSSVHGAAVDHLVSSLDLPPTQKEQARHLVRLARKHQNSSQPSRPPLKLLAQGKHVLFLCVGTKASQEFRLGIEHFVRPQRDRVKPMDIRPIVVLAPTQPTDWHTVASFRDVYFLEGSPHSQFDLERANFTAAAFIYICSVANSDSCSDASESWMIDADVICCTRLVESQLDRGSATKVMVELTSDENCVFLPVRGDLLDPSQDEGFGSESITSNALNAFRQLKTRTFESFSEASIRGSEKMFGSSKAEEPVVLEYYRQARFASGQLLVGSIATALAVNTFYSPSLAQVVSTMISSNVLIVPASKEWIGKFYFEYFEWLLWSQELLGVGIFREGQTQSDPLTRKRGSRSSRSSRSSVSDRAGKQQVVFSYMITAPPAKVTMVKEMDRIVCFGKSYLEAASIKRTS